MRYTTSLKLAHARLSSAAGAALLVLAAAASLGMGHCSPTVTPTPTPSAADAGALLDASPGVGTVVVDCAIKSAQQFQILSAVSSALASPSWEATLGALAVQYGFDVVNCAVRQLISQDSIHMRTSPNDTLAPVRMRNGQAWLTKHPMTFKP